MRFVWFPTFKCQNYNIVNPKDRSLRCLYCPYGYDNGLLINNKQVCGLEHQVDCDTVIKFLKTNETYLGNIIEFSGGEPTLYPHLVKVLKELSWNWAITSNTCVVSTVRKLDESGALGRCVAWTASYHLLSGHDKEFAESIKILHKHKVRTPVTIVVAKETLDKINGAILFLHSIGITQIQCHIDAHRENENPDYVKQMEIAIKQYSDVAVAFNAAPRKNVICNLTKELLVMSPEGDIFPCATILYCCSPTQNNERIPICRITGDLDLRALPNTIVKCPLECLAPCDFSKHVSWEN